ncbi:MAG: hypothetical protein Q8L80_10775 [Gallionella sp.]|nr:hypothetical protein [Gallionella sp.]
MSDNGKKLIRNSTAEFLIFTGQAGEARNDGKAVLHTRKRGALE